MALQIWLNGQERLFDTLAPGASLSLLVQALDLRPDRVAVELRGDIVRKPAWSQTAIAQGDRVEIVHFVGGG